MRFCELCYAIDGVRLLEIDDQIVCEKCEVFLIHDDYYHDDNDDEETEDIYD